MKNALYLGLILVFASLAIQKSNAQIITEEVKVQANEGKTQIEDNVEVIEDKPAFKGRGKSAVLKVKSAAYPESAIGTGFIEHDGYGDFLLGTTDSNEPAYNGFTRIFAGGSEWLTITGDGKVGLGTTDPQATLDIKGGLRISNSNLPAGFATEVGGNTPLLNMDVNFRQPGRTNDHLGAAFRIDTRSSYPIFQWLYRFANSSTETILMAMSHDGKLGIKTENPAYTLHVNGSSYSSGGWSGSDIRFKKNVAPIANGLTTLLALRGVSFDWRHEEFEDRSFPEKREIGFIAQEVEEHLPEVVNTDLEGYKAISYEKITALLVEAIKELKAEKDAEIQALKDRIRVLESNSDIGDTD